MVAVKIKWTVYVSTCMCFRQVVRLVLHFLAVLDYFLTGSLEFSPDKHFLF